MREPERCVITLARERASGIDLGARPGSNPCIRIHFEMRVNFMQGQRP
jgi:hypothetical protein